MDADIIRFMKKQGLRITESRIRIIEAICRSGGFISNVETLWFDLRATQPISRATIYNTVRLMSQFGILQGECRENGLISYRFAANKTGKINGIGLVNTPSQTVSPE
jgi:Fe2+ or Zn2+ uptake regulation protein